MKYGEALLELTKLRFEFKFGAYQDLSLEVAEGFDYNKDKIEYTYSNEVDTQRAYLIGLALIGATNYCSDNDISPGSDECDHIFNKEVRDFYLNKIE